MGAKFAKLDCTGCFLRKKKRKEQKAKLDDNTVKHENQTSSQILRDLKDVGFFNAVTKTTGVTFVIEPEKRTRKIPRRLPKLRSTKMPEVDHLPSTATPKVENSIYNKEEKDLMVEIRRIGALADKGTMAKIHAIRRRDVIKRKEARLREKISRTEQKLKRHVERLPSQTPCFKNGQSSSSCGKKTTNWQKVIKRRHAKNDQMVNIQNTSREGVVEQEQDTSEVKEHGGLPEVST